MGVRSDQWRFLRCFQQKLHECILDEAGAKWNEDSGKWAWPSDAFLDSFGTPSPDADSEEWVFCGNVAILPRIGNVQDELAADATRIFHESVGVDAYRELCTCPTASSPGVRSNT